MRRGRGFFDKFENSSLVQQGPTFGRGFAPPYGGMLGTNGSGRRQMYGSGIRKRRSKRGRGIFDHIKSAWNYIKGNKSITDAAKSGASFLGTQAKKVIAAKADAAKRQADKIARVKTNEKRHLHKGKDGKEMKTSDLKPSTTTTAVTAAAKDKIKPGFKPTGKELVPYSNKPEDGRAAYLSKLKAMNGGRILRKLTQRKKTRRAGGMLVTKSQRGAGLPPIPSGMRP